MTDRSLSKRSHVFLTPPSEGSPFRVREECGVNLSVVEAARPRYLMPSTFSVCPTLFRSHPLLTSSLTCISIIE